MLRPISLTDLGLPVLQVEVGNFISTGGHALAVLHPRKLAVYTLQAKGNQQQTSFYQLQLAYEHRLDHTGRAISAFVVGIVRLVGRTQNIHVAKVTGGSL